ncbi:NAD(P)-binding protein [Mycena venus]|uniref:NAD(P)-binding protein n=1 Tax=Mycena venus TaxID=2733690 RepID=A0A8H6Z598_9AGAR|nr:NAD(P)-binding protein [Mycena venus]
MTILLTGGTGKTATPLAKLLPKGQHSRTIGHPEGVRFDWLDASTYRIPFDADDNIDRVYLVAPAIIDVFPPMKAFIDFAIQKGVKRFVLMSATMLKEGGPMMGKVHEYLHSCEVDYCALRPSWFFDNLLLHYSDTIRKHDEIVNAAGSGLIGWISTDDIADVAFKAFTDKVIEHTNPVMVGPELLSYAQIAQIMSDVFGRKITHRTISADEYKKIVVRRGFPEEWAALVSATDLSIAEGAEEKVFKQADFMGERRLRDFIESYRDAEEWKSV